MKSALLARGCASLLLLAAAAGPAPANAQSPAGNPAYAAEVETKIARVTADIVPLVVADTPDRPRTSLEARMRALAVPGVSIAVIKDGKLEWARGFGVAKVGGPPVTTQTLFAAASVSKPIAAFGALKLVQDRKIDLDTDVNRYLTSWKLPENDFTREEKVTLRRLLTHTGGTTVHGFGGYVPGTPYPTLQQILDGAPPSNTAPIRVDTKPGTIWRYSGGGYTIAQQMVIDVAGKPFHDYQVETVFRPLDMNNSSFEQPLPAAKLANAATPYGNNLNPIPGGARVDPSLMAAGLWTTPSDLARYVIEVQQAAAGRSGKVLSPAMVQQMIKGDGLEHWGLGPLTGGEGAGRWFGHGGDDPGFHNELVGFLNGDGAIVMTNSDGGAQLADEVLRTIAHVYGWENRKPIVRQVVKASPADMDGLVGVYRTGRFSTVRVWRDGDALLGQASNAPTPSRLYASGPRNWFFADVDVQYVVETDASGQAQKITARRPAFDTVYTRLAPGEAERLSQELVAKVRERTQDPNTEAALRSTIEGLRRGAPDFSRMTPAIADVTRRQLAALSADVNANGAVKKVVFRGVGPGGADVYFVQFEKRPTEWRVMLGPDGKLESIGFGAPQLVAGEAERMAAFKEQDADGDGRIDKAAYGRLLESVGFAGELDRLFTQRDVNRDGVITREEFSPPVQ